MNYSFPTSRVSAFLFLFESRFDLSDLSVDYWITLAGCLIHHTIYPLERQCGFETGLFNKHLVQVAPLARVFYINIIMLSFDMDSGYFILLCCFFLQVVVDEGWARDFLDNATRRIFTSSAVIPAGSTVTFDFLSDSLLYWFVCSPKQKKDLVPVVCRFRVLATEKKNFNEIFGWLSTASPTKMRPDRISSLLAVSLLFLLLRPAASNWM